MSQPPRAMIYGATGYTGRLVAEEAVARGMKPVLAGRNYEAVASLASKLDCAAMGFSLQQPARIAEHLRGFTAVLNCAGPFSQTARVMIEACLSVGVHYLDITGEIDVIELAASRGQAARQADVALIPAVGFDVVPSDCLAALLADRLPSAKVLQLAFTDTGGVSPGTAKTMLEAVPRGGRVRINGEIRDVPTAWKLMEIPFRDGRRWAMTIPWGDVASAYYSTGIPNIEVYAAASRKQIKQLRGFRFLLPIMGWGPLQRMGRRWIDRNIKGPTSEQLEKARSMLWGRVSDDQGNTARATLDTLSGYKLTAVTSVLALQRAAEGQVPHGFSTASQAFGKDFILSIPSTDLRWETAEATQLNPKEQQV